VYGGVQFGLQKFNLAATVARMMSMEGQAPRLQAVAGAKVPATLSTPSHLSAALGAPRGAEALQGVDLRLDQFNLSKAKNVSIETSAGSWRSLSKQGVPLGTSFFTSIDASPQLFKADDTVFLRNVFNPLLSDRRQEGDLFVPPDATCSYVEKLRGLVKQEESLRHMRTEQFFSTDFVMGDPGPLFPHSWTPSLAVARGRTAIPEGLPHGTLQECPEYKAQAQQVLEKATPIFDKTTEEGLRFRIYRQGSIEIRTTQKPREAEVIGVVFSIRNQHSHLSLKKQALAEGDAISKVTEYVEHNFAPNDDPSSLHRRFFLVLETAGGHTVVAERLDSGDFSWSEDPADLDDRRSLAKVTRTQSVTSGMTVQELKLLKGQLCNSENLSNKRFSRALFYYAASAADANLH
jgi:hypothetical protein